ncbi:TRAP transporter substrate-binding protein [Domibacillus sp. PGB-M46]|uniref:TRAP transporter substrate-binding protein n=1 Tax=Domibacillus sp. PGB-M46 TaxID=2910255 RepID=UPI001F581511|nr:TRAP transporter substrate-binding protein [Domibacillus sp. PGB-M46]MCI2256284.1 TRAP transporter substrate-binding protein [Domibacillus sp. PGB-M46]
MKKCSIWLVAAVIMMLAGCSGASTSGKGESAEVKTMKMAVATSKDRSLTKGLDKFKEIVEKESNGSIKVQVFPDGQLGGDRAVFEGLKMNSIQGTTMSSGPIASFVKEFEVLDFPYLFEDEETAYRVLDGEIGTELLKKLDSQGIVGLNYWENGFRQLTNNKHEVKSIKDVKGLKIRTLENELHVDLWKSLGANPSPMPYTELFTALEQGVVDGQENPAGNITTGNFYEVQKYVTKTDHIYNASVFMISDKFMQTLSDEEKEMVTKAAEEARDYQRELNQKESEEAFAALEKEGMKVTELSDEARKGFENKAKEIYSKYTEKVGKELVDEIMNEVK